MNYVNIFFLNIIKTSLVSSFLVVIIILLRVTFHKKIKTNYIYSMWIILLVRLLLPLNFESNVSIENIMFNDDIIEYYEGAIEERTINKSEDSYGYFFEEVKTTINIPETANKAISILSIIWIFGILVILFIPIITYVTLKKELEKSETSLDENVINASKKARMELGILKNVKIVKSTLIDSPSLIGLKNPMVVLPKHLNGNYEDSYKIFLHELIHYDKRHLLYQWMFWILKAVYWFNPFIWIAHYLMKQDAEYMCDEKAIEILCDNEGYGNLILDISENISNDNYMINTVGFSYKKKELKNRIIRIMSKKKNHILLRIMCTLCLVILIPIFFTSYQKVEKQVDAIVINHELNIVGNNDILNAKILNYEYSSGTGELIVDIEYEINEEFIDNHNYVYSNDLLESDEEEIFTLFDVQLLFPASKNPKIRNEVIHGNLHSQLDNFRRFSFEICKYDFEQFGNAVFRIQQVNLEVNIGTEDIHELSLKDMPINFKLSDMIDISIEKLLIDNDINLELVIRGYKGKPVTAGINVYGEVDGYKVKPNSGGVSYWLGSNEK